MANKKTGAENVRWDLSALYASIDDPQIDKDLATLTGMYEKIGSLKGQLSTKLSQALSLLCESKKLENKLGYFLFLSQSTDVTNEKIQSRQSQVMEKISEASAEHVNYFDHEVVALSDETYETLLGDTVVAHHKPMLDEIRKNAKYLLSEDVEQALAKRASFGSREWDQFVDEMEAGLTFKVGRKAYTFNEALHEMNTHKDEDKRLQFMQAINKGLADQNYVKFRARALNYVMGEKAVEDKERGYASPISMRNIRSNVDDATVDALHKAVKTVGAQECQRFYQLKFALMGKEGAQPWSNRNAPLPFASNKLYTWEKTVKLVLDAYGSFSPTLQGLVQQIMDSNWVDAPPVSGKDSGAFNASGAFPEGNFSYNLLNHYGSVRDVMTAAHELGHGVHGLLAAEAQGPLQMRAPMIYAETASIFGEMVTFNYLMDNMKSDKERLVMLISKTDGFMNSVVRQISFSLFEMKIHEKRKEGKLSVSDFNQAWLDVTREFYGEDGTLFKYDDIENLWSYVGHFMRPFYVYAYAFGELFTQSLYAVKDNCGDDFEPMYLDLLRSGGTKNAKELMAPFGLDPANPTFWEDGIKCSVSKWLDEAEVLAKKLGYIS